MKILHLIDPGSPGCGASTLRMLADSINQLDEMVQHALIIGTGRQQRLARRCGVDPLGWVCPPDGLFAAGGRLLRMFVDTVATTSGPYDLIHAWSPRAAALAVSARPDVPCLVTLQVGPVTERQVRCLARLRGIHVFAASTAVQREYRSLGLESRRIGLLPPGIDIRAHRIDARAAVRARWAADYAITDRTFIVGLMSEPVNWTDVRTAVRIAALVRLTGRDVKLLVHHTAARRVEGERFADSVGASDLIVVDDAMAEPWRVVAGMDAALLFDGGPNGSTWNSRSTNVLRSILEGGERRLRPLPSVLPLLWAFAAGVPVIAENTDAARGVIDDGVNGLLVQPGDVNAASGWIARLHDDRSLAAVIGTAAEGAVNDLYRIDSYGVRLKHVYELLLADRAVQLIPHATS